MPKPKHHTSYLIAQGGHWYYRRRVPLLVAHLDQRGIIKTTTRVRVIDDPKGQHRAAKIASRLDEANKEYWSNLLQGHTDQARQQLKAAIKRAQLLGYVYHSAAEVAVLPLPDIIDRGLTLLDDPKADPHDKIDRMALVGGPAKSSILLSDLVRSYQDIVKLEIRNKSKSQLKQWLKVRGIAVTNFIAVVGDKDLLSLTRDDGKAFRAWWSERITEEDLSTELARQQVTFLRKMIRVVCEDHDFDDPEPFHKITFKPSVNKRMPFAADFVRDVILGPGRLNGLDDDVRDVLLACIDTGARVSEIISIPKTDIHLRSNVPHIDIRDGNGREVKTRNAVRKIPLVGVALEAMQRHPNGFPQFHDGGDHVRKLMNAHLKKLQTDVNEDEGEIYKTIHCLRHTFKDRLRKTNAREELIDAILGHSSRKPDYGYIDLEAKLEVMNQLVFTRPSVAPVA